MLEEVSKDRGLYAIGKTGSRILKKIVESYFYCSNWAFSQTYPKTA
jgi:hypothetical protein